MFDEECEKHKEELEKKDKEIRDLKGNSHVSHESKIDTSVNEVSEENNQQKSTSVNEILEENNQQKSTSVNETPEENKKEDISLNKTLDVNRYEDVSSENDDFEDNLFK